MADEAVVWTMDSVRIQLRTRLVVERANGGASRIVIDPMRNGKRYRPDDQKGGDCDSLRQRTMTAKSGDHLESG
jgi:hypothetical protein